MGQAKRRGTYEQRKAQAIARRGGIVLNAAGEQIASVVPPPRAHNWPHRRHSPLAVAALMAMAMHPYR